MSHARAQDRTSRLGRLAGLIVFGALAAGFTSVCAVQIIQQVWFPNAARSEERCQDGLRELIHALGRARALAGKASGERAALDAFRRGLMPAWSAQSSLAEACRESPDLARAFGEVEGLRYAEEHAVRHEAPDLAARRRRVASLARELGPE
jgi:hypothetical protein